MLSPFPGMDPFVEQQEWDDFHVSFNVAISDELTSRLAPRYIVRMKRRSYTEAHGDSESEAYLLIRLKETTEVVTVLETLSPANKRPGGDGKDVYVQSRRNILQGPANLVEVDLLRGGARMPMENSLPTADYYAIISRCDLRPAAAVYAWTMRDRLPTISVPLKKGDPDVQLDLQAVFDAVYDRARYDLSLNYTAELQPPLSCEDAEWIRGLLPAHKSP